MKTTLERLKALVAADSTLSTYVQRNEIVSPRALPALSMQDIYYIGFAPINAPEAWITSAKKERICTVEAYLVLLHMIREDAIIGDDNRKGVLDFVSEFETAVRGSFLPDPDDSTNTDTYHLSKPLDVTGVEFSGAEEYGDGHQVIVAIVTLEARILFNA
jgi:hypothetical protein